MFLAYLFAVFFYYSKDKKTDLTRKKKILSESKCLAYVVKIITLKNGFSLSIYLNNQFEKWRTQFFLRTLMNDSIMKLHHG